MQTHDVDTANDSDLIRISDVMAFFEDTWRQIAMGAFLAACIGTAYAWLDQPQYKATVSVQLAKVTNVDVEAPSVVLEKVLVPSYFVPSTLIACGVDTASETVGSMAKIINPVLSKTSALLALSVKRPSVQEAKSCLDAVLVDIRSNQNDVAQGMLKLKQAQIAALRGKLDVAEQVLRLYPSNTKHADFSGERYAGAALLFAMSSVKQAEVSDLRARISDLELALLEPQTRQASFATPITALNAPVGPSKPLIVALALLLGATLAIIYLLLRRALMASSRTAARDS